MSTSSTSNPSPELPPLSVEETERIISRIAPAINEHRLVLIGGQAVALWRSQLDAYLPAGEHTVASRDVDFQGTDRAVGAIADLLNGTWRMPGHDSKGPLSGVVTFADSDGYEREVDFLPKPHGMRGANVARNAQEIEIRSPAGPPTRLYVMHPLDVLYSRVANSDLPEKQTQRARNQIAAAIALVPAYGRHLLDLGGLPRDVVNMNNTVFGLANQHNKRAMRLYFEHNLDVAQAVLDDERLPALHRDQELPELRAQLATAREHYTQHASAPDAASPPASPLSGEGSYYERFRGPNGPGGGLDR